MSYTPWNGPPEFKPFGWPEPTTHQRELDSIQPWNGPDEFKPHDWDSKQMDAIAALRSADARR